MGKSTICQKHCMGFHIFPKKTFPLQLYSLYNFAHVSLFVYEWWNSADSHIYYAPHLMVHTTQLETSLTMSQRNHNWTFLYTTEQKSYLRFACLLLNWRQIQKRRHQSVLLSGPRAVENTAVPDKDAMVL